MFAITKEQLHADALKSAPAANPTTLRRMGDVLGEMTGMEPEDLIPSDQPQLYVASTKENYHGAACIFYPGFLERTKKVIGDQFFIIPSSVHILQNFRMFSGEPAEVVPECENEVMCSIIDRFGYEVRA